MFARLLVMLAVFIFALICLAMVSRHIYDTAETASAVDNKLCSKDAILNHTPTLVDPYLSVSFSRISPTLYTF